MSNTLENRIKKLENETEGLKRFFDLKKSQKEILTKKANSLDEKIKALNLPVLEEVNAFLQKLSEDRRKEACTKFIELGTSALQYALGSDYSIDIEISDIRKKPNAELYIVKKSTGLRTLPVDDNGGGAVDILSLALRIVILMNSDDFIDGPIIMDEPFKMVSAEYVSLVTDFVKKISKEFGRQIIMVTHNTFLAENCDTIISVNNIDGISEIKIEKR